MISGTPGQRRGFVAVAEPDASGPCTEPVECVWKWACVGAFA
jgi:hypothetical protein